METGRFAAGSSRTGTQRASAVASARRLDPFSLPVRFAAADAAADEHLCIVDLHRERVVLRRSVRGMRMAVNLPIVPIAASRSGCPAPSASSSKRLLWCSNTPIPHFRCHYFAHRRPTRLWPSGNLAAT